MAGTFAAQVDAWVAKTKERMVAVFLEAAQRVIEQAQTPVAAGGNMPIDTGFLRASLVTTLNAPAAGIRFREEDVMVHHYSGTETALTIAGARIGDTIYAVWTANYASYVEYGVNGQPGRGFVRLAAQNWQQIVDEVTRDAVRRSLANGLLDIVETRRQELG